MRHRKANMKAPVLLLLLSLALVLCLPLSAEATGIGQIDTVPISFSMPPVVAGEVSALGVSLSAQGCYIAGVGWQDVYGRPLTGQFGFDNATVVITVNASPGYYFSSNVQVGINGEHAPFESRGSQLVISKTFSPVVWAPNIVKHPGSEKVSEGGMVSFVSLASFTTESVWTVIDTEGVHYSLDKLAEKFPQLVFHVTYSKLNMGPVPMEMNGYKVRCSFSGPGGSVDSGYAEISVEKSALPAAQEQPALPPHDHVYGEELVSDAGFHWHACFCGAADMKVEHDFIWLQKRQATLDAPGLVQGRCSDCGYTLDCRTQLDPDAAEALRKEAAKAKASAPTASSSPAPSPSASPAPHEKVPLIDSIKGLFSLFKADEREYYAD